MAYKEIRVARRTAPKRTAMQRLAAWYRSARSRGLTKVSFFVGNAGGVSQEAFAEEALRAVGAYESGAGEDGGDELDAGVAVKRRGGRPRGRNGVQVNLYIQHGDAALLRKLADARKAAGVHVLQGASVSAIVCELIEAQRGSIETAIGLLERENAQWRRNAK